MFLLGLLPIIDIICILPEIKRPPYKQPNQQIAGESSKNVKRNLYHQSYKYNRNYGYQQYNTYKYTVW